MDKVTRGEDQEKHEVIVAEPITTAFLSKAVELREVQEGLVDKEKTVEVLDQSISPRIQKALRDIEAMVNSRKKTKVVPKQLVVLGSNIKHIVTQVLFHLYQPAFQEEVCLETAAIVDDTQALLWSIPWVQVTEEEELSNSQCIDTSEVINTLDKVLGPKPLVGALGIGSQILSRYIVHLVGLSIAKTVPDVYAANEEERHISQDMVNICPLPAKFVISGELLGDFVVKFMLHLHPMNRLGSKQLSQQALLLLVVKMASVVFNVLRKIPGVSVDEQLCAPICNMRQTVFHMQNALVHKFGTTIQIKHMVANKDPLVISTIPQAICEGILTVYKGISVTHPLQVTGPHRPIAKSYEKAMETKLFAVTLPEALKKTIYHHYGSRVGKLPLFQKAFPPLTSHDKFEYIRHVTPPLSSKRDTIWVHPKYFFGDDDEEEESSDNTVPHNPLALNVSKAAFLNQFPLTDIFQSNTTDFIDRKTTPRYVPVMVNVQTGDSVVASSNPFDVETQQDEASTGPKPDPKPVKPQRKNSEKIKSYIKSGQYLKDKRLYEQALYRYSGQAVRDQALREAERNKPKIIIVPLVLVWNVFNYAFLTTRYVPYDSGLCNDMVDHIHIKIQKEALKYKDHRVFKSTLKNLEEDPLMMSTFVLNCCQSFVIKYWNIVQDHIRSKEQLHPDKLSLLVCDLMVGEIMTHLRPTLTFSKDTKDGDNRPYCINVPVKRDTSSPDDADKTKLELRIEKARADQMKELLVPSEPKDHSWAAWMEMMEEYEQFHKKKSCWDWFCGLFGRKKKTTFEKRVEDFEKYCRRSN
ncbi:uncharacterized protein LOC105012216 isoform X2 [Esox lucius]|uniref:uncharacterized protein LOC105012216 isoform X2 n=1 Tax=Esox lucius TaxID=8010 RepID=UPI001476B322|nr:uncharacterized protein LOC105012216 isoform X2 [Esox lucius]